MKKIFVLIIPVLFLISGCRKDDDKNEVDLTAPLLIPQEVKDYSQFKPGTYWVYIDSLTGKEDSQYVTYLKSGFDTLKIYDNPSRPYEWFETEFKSVMDGCTYYYYCSTSYSYADPTKFILFYSKINPGHSGGKTQLYLYKAFKGQTFYDAPVTKVVNDVYSSYLQDGIVYKDVMNIYQEKSYVEISNHVTNFIAKNFGFVRREYADSNQIWKLARSSIVQ